MYISTVKIHILHVVTEKKNQIISYYAFVCRVDQKKGKLKATSRKVGGGRGEVQLFRGKHGPQTALGTELSTRMAWSPQCPFAAVSCST